MREWVRAPGADATAINDIILLHMMPKYGVSNAFTRWAITVLMVTSQRPGGKAGTGKRVYKRTLEEMEEEKPTENVATGRCLCK